MPKKGVWITFAFAAAIVAALLVPTNRVRERLTLAVIGWKKGGTDSHLVVVFPKALKSPHRPPWGHKAWSYTTIELNCAFPNGTSTNITFRQEGGGGRSLQTNGPHLDLIYSFKIPPMTEKVRIIGAETVLGSFQDLAIPINRRPCQTVFRYEVPAEALTVPAFEVGVSP